MKISKRDLERALLKYYGKNNLGVDCISREAAITFVCKNTKEILKDTMPLEVKLSDDYLYENVAKIMRNPKVLPPVTPQPRWIPVSERLPKAGEYVGNVAKYYLVQNEYGDMLVARYDGMGWEQMYQHEYLEDAVIAWMPLPAPYEPQESEE